MRKRPVWGPFWGLPTIDSCWHAQHGCAPCQPALCWVKQLASQQGLHVGTTPVAAYMARLR